jgi:hypothetical protein
MIIQLKNVEKNAVISAMILMTIEIKANISKEYNDFTKKQT